MAAIQKKGIKPVTVNKTVNKNTLGATAHGEHRRQGNFLPNLPKISQIFPNSPTAAIYTTARVCGERRHQPPKRAQKNAPPFGRAFLN